MPVCERRGQRRVTKTLADALRGAFLAAAFGLAGLALHAAPARAQATPPVATPDENPLIQRGVPAEATAETAVIARDQALNAGQRLAYDRMAAALGLPRGIPDSQIEGMVQSLVIESERITNRGYAARLTVNFNPARVAAAGGRAPTAPSSPGGGFPTATAPTPGGPTVATVEALARYRSFPEWVEITRRLATASPVARYEVLTIAGDMARLRLALRAQPPEAAAELAASGIALAPGPIDARPGEGWRLGLAGGR